MYFTSLLIRLKHVRQVNVYSVRNLKFVSENYNEKLVSLKTALNNLPERFDSLKTAVNNIKLPERFKGTVVEKWSVYWKDLCNDYFEVARESVTSAKNNPRKSLIYFMCFGFAVYLNKTNPTETSFRDALLSASNEVMLVSKQLRNPESDNHIIFIESCYNAGVIRNFSFGLFSVMWFDDYDNAVGLYKANCSYLQPQYLTLYERVIDVGFLNRWWFLKNVMNDYDVNPTEWSSG